MNTNETKDIVNKYGFRFSKSLGQNFLIDNSVLEDIIDGADISKDDFIIEIGPGIGTLTRELLEKAGFVAAIELDTKLIKILQKEFTEFNNFKLIHGDAMKIDFHELIGDKKSVKLVANLPYYITTPIILKVLTGGYDFKSLTIMIQKEVAERIAAKPDCSEYGALTVLVQYYCTVHIIRNVSKECFIPKPKVESTVINLNKLKSPSVKVKNEKLFFDVVRSSFNMRRKTLRNALKSLKLSEDIMQKAFEKAHIDPKRRGETLSLEEFALLSDEIGYFSSLF